MLLRAIVCAGGLASLPVAVGAATVEAFAGITVRLSNLSTGDGGNLIGVAQFGLGETEETEGDGTAVLSRTLVAGGSPVLTVNEYFVSRRVDAAATADLEGYGQASGTQRVWFEISRASDTDAFIDIALEPLDGLGGQIIGVFGRADRVGDIGAAFARITLERSDFEGTLFSEQAFVNLVGLGAGDFNAASRNLIPPFVLQDVLIPRQTDTNTSPVRFTLDILVETSALVEADTNGPAVIPVPPAAPLLAFGLAALFGLRGMHRRRRG